MITIDEQQLNRDLAKWGEGVSRYADGGLMSMSQAVADQSRIVIEEVAKGAPPKSLSALGKKIDSDVKGVFRAMPPVRYLRDSGEGGGDVQWIGSGPNFLTGVQAKFYRPDSDASDMAATYKVRRGKMGKAYLPAGKRGKQSVQMLNRILVRKAAISKFVSSLKAKGGRLKASVCIGWAELNARTGKGKQPAAWIMRHIGNGARGSFGETLGNKEFPSVTIVSNAPGCSKPAMLNLVHSVLTSRLHKIQSDFKNGYIFKRHGK